MVEVGLLAEVECHVLLCTNTASDEASLQV